MTGINKRKIGHEVFSPKGRLFASVSFPSTAKAFLGTFSVNRLPHDPVIKSFKSETMHEIQREIIQLVRGGEVRSTAAPLLHS